MIFNEAMVHTQNDISVGCRLLDLSAGIYISNERCHGRKPSSNCSCLALIPHKRDNTRRSQRLSQTIKYISPDKTGNTCAILSSQFQ